MPITTNVLLGDTRSEQCSDGHPMGLAEASSFVATATGTVASLSIDYAGGTSNQLILALYSDDSANLTPAQLLATAMVTQSSNIGSGVYTAATDTMPAVTAGSRYWISVFCVSGSSCSFRYTYTPGGSADTCGGGGSCVPADSNCTMHSASSSLGAPEITWSPGGDTYGLSVNSFWASGP